MSLPYIIFFSFLPPFLPSSLLILGQLFSSSKHYYIQIFSMKSVQSTCSLLSWGTWQRFWDRRSGSTWRMQWNVWKHCQKEALHNRKVQIPGLKGGEGLELAQQRRFQCEWGLWDPVMRADGSNRKPGLVSQLWVPQTDKISLHGKLWERKKFLTEVLEQDVGMEPTPYGYLEPGLYNTVVSPEEHSGTHTTGKARRRGPMGCSWNPCGGDIFV